MHLDLERDLNRGALEPTRELLASASRGRSRENAWTVPHGSSYGLVTVIAGHHMLGLCQVGSKSGVVVGAISSVGVRQLARRTV